MPKQLLSTGLFMILFWPSAPSSAQPTLDRPVSGSQGSRTVERTVAVDSGKSARVGVYTNIKKDCTSGPLPIVRLTDPPHDGRLVVKRAKVRVTGGGACPVAEVPGLIARYQSRPGFSGADKVTIEIKKPDDEAISSQTITIDVKPAIQTRSSGTTNVTPTAAPRAPNVNEPPAAAPSTSNSNQPAVPNVPNENAEVPENSSNRTSPANIFDSNLNGTSLGTSNSVDPRRPQPDDGNAATEIPH